MIAPAHRVAAAEHEFRLFPAECGFRLVRGRDLP